ncbi:MAG: CPBP family glutamic-type intramembrane protease, partial [Terriglobales bacterium]
LEPGAPASSAIAQAEHRHVVRVQGAAVGAYNEYLKIPEQWSRDFAQLRAKNLAAGEVDSGLLLIVFVALLFVLVMRIRRNDIRWRTAIWIGVAGTILSLLASLNSLGAARFFYDTRQPFSSFVANTLLGYAASAVGVGVFLLVLTAAAESLYRERFGKLVALPSILSWRGVRSKSFFLSMVLGLALAALFFAYQAVFYLVANHFGAWAPADVPYDQLLNTRLPWAFVLFGGFFPAISEEFGFRMFAIPLFEKWFRWLWVAIIAASFLWGFGHATYPNEPWFIRGVEVGLGGVLLSWVMVRFGILTTVVWHYTVDALYSALLLLRAHDAYLRWSGATTALLALAPLIVAIVAYRWHGGFAPERDLTNAALGSAAAAEPIPAVAATAKPVEATATAEPGAPSPSTYVPISGPNWTTGLIVAGALLSAFAVPTASWRSVLPWRTGPDSAIAAARRFLGQNTFSVTGFRAAVGGGTALESAHGGENRVAAGAIFSARGLRPLQQAFSGRAPTVPAEFWMVRFFKPLNDEEYEVLVRADNGQVTAFHHQLPETAAGGAPTPADAQATAAAFLASRGIDVRRMQLQAPQQQKLPARTDSSFVWQAGTGAITYRAQATLSGTTISGYTAWYHVPEASTRAYAQRSLGETLLGVLKGLLYAAAAALVFGLLIRFARQTQLAWPVLIKIAAAGGVVTLLITANSYPAALLAYPTNIPWPAYQLTIGIGWLVAALGGFLLTLALLAPLAITAPAATALTRANARRQLERETAWDALWVGVLGLAWALGWARVQEVVNARWHGAGSAPFPAPPQGLAQAVPGLSDILNGPLHALWIAAFLGILFPVISRAWHGRDRWWAVGGIVLLFFGTFPAIHNAGQMGPAAIFSGVGLVLLFGFGALFLRDNPLAYLSAALLPSLVSPALAWLGLETPGVAAIGIVLLAMALAWLLALAIVSRQPARPQSGTLAQPAAQA